MIKTSILILSAASLTGLSALPDGTLAPKSVDLSAGGVSLIKEDGQTKLTRSPTTTFALRMTTQSERTFTLRF